MNRLPASQRHKRHEKRWPRDEKQLTGHQIQIDVKFIEPLWLKGSRKQTSKHTGVVASVA